MQSALALDLGLDEAEGMSSPTMRYLSMYYIRQVEQGIVDRYADQEMRCPVHLSIGQEATAVGVSSALLATDKVYSNHRCHAHYLAKGGDLYRMLCEIYGKADGCVGGRGGSMHLMDRTVGVEISIPIVGSSVPLAVGQALFDRRRGNGQVTVCYLGDGALEEGVFHECANFAALHELPVLFACENNLYSVYTPLNQRQPDRPLTDLAEAHGIEAVKVDGNDVESIATAASAAVSALRDGKGPIFLEMPTYRFREHCGPNDDDHLGYRTDGELQTWLEKDPVNQARRMVIQGGLCEESSLLGGETRIDVFVNEAFERARLARLPQPETLRDSEYVPSSKGAVPATGSGTRQEITFAHAVRGGLGEAMRRDPEVLLMGEGIDDPSAFWGTTKGLAAAHGMDRVIEMPISELGMTGIAIGAAMNGARPVINLQRVEFALLAVEQIVNNAGKAYFASNGLHTAPITMRMIIGRGWGQGPQHAQSLESMFAHFPGLKVVLPSFPDDAKGMLCASVADNNPVLFIEHRWLHYARGSVDDGYYETPLDGPRTVRTGQDVTLVTSSFMTLEAVRAVDLLARFGISVELVDLRVIRPLNIEPIRDSVHKTGRLICVDLGWSLYGVASEIVSQIAESSFDRLAHPPVRIGPAPYPTPSSRGLIGNYYPSAKNIVDAVMIMLEVGNDDRGRIIDALSQEVGTVPIDVPDPAFKGPF